MIRHHIPVERIVMDAYEYGECMFLFEVIPEIIEGLKIDKTWIPEFVEDWCIDVLAGIAKPTNEIGGEDEKESGTYNE